MSEIKRMFSPEFRNRLDATISFAALDNTVILKVVEKFLMQLEAQLHEKKVEAHFTDELKAWLASEGFDPLMGARPMARLIQDAIRSALADELLFGKLANGGRVTIDLDEEGKVKLLFDRSSFCSTKSKRRRPERSIDSPEGDHRVAFFSQPRRLPDRCA